MINHHKVEISVMGGLWEGWESLGGLGGRALLGHILGPPISKGRYHGGPMVKIILKILVKFPMVK
jgi:hypothetical protein